MENDRREDQQSTPPAPEASRYEEPRREWESSSAADAPHDAPREDRGDDGPREHQPSYEGAPPQEGGGQPPPQGQGPGGPMGPGGGRGRRRGGRGRMAPRDRGMRGGRGRDRDRRPAPSYNRPPAGAGGPGAHPPDEREREERGYGNVPPEERSLVMQARAEVERIRETLDGVLRDLEDVCEQLTKAEHEKDIAEAEIEQLRESLRRLQR